MRILTTLRSFFAISYRSVEKRCLLSTTNPRLFHTSSIFPSYKKEIRKAFARAQLEDRKQLPVVENTQHLIDRVSRRQVTMAEQAAIEVLLEPLRISVREQVLVGYVLHVRRCCHWHQ